VPRIRLGYLGPAIVLVGAAVAGLAIWFMQSVRPVAGAEIDRIAIDARRSFVLRNEATTDRSFIELRDGDQVKWQALIPHYAGAPGRPAVAWSEKAVTVRVERNGRAEVFAFAMENAAKLGAFRLAHEREPITMHAEGPITLTDNVRSYEIVGGVDWHQLIAVDILHGGGVWKVDLGRAPITAGGVRGTEVWLEQAAKRRVFDSASGRETPAIKTLN
jgi:hypothetical protein